MGPDDLEQLRACVALAERARAAGDQPFGSRLVDGDGALLAEAVNTVRTDRDVTAHPELKLARWASQHLDAEDAAAATMYTSGEHCPMCVVAHGEAGIGRLVYAFSAAQLHELTGGRGWGTDAATMLAARGLDVVVEGPAPELEAACRRLHRTG